MNPTNPSLPGSGDAGYTKNPENFGYSIRQQTMQAWQAVPTMNTTLCILFFISAFFLALGGVLLHAVLTVVETSVEYTECTGHPCRITFSPPSKMSHPVFFYYELTNYYQNHHIYLKSRDNAQLKGDVLSPDAVFSSCDPIIRIKDMDLPGIPPTMGENVANPCGLVAKSLFNDTYELREGNRAIRIHDKGIAWPTDINYRYKRSAQQQWTNVEDERFMNWMRTAAFPTFRKLWGRIEEDLYPNATYTIFATSNYNVSGFGGTKSVFLSTATQFGGRNLFLTILFIAVGGVTFLLFLIFLVKKFTTPDKYKILEAKCR